MQDNSPTSNNLDLALSSFNFWRASIGVTFRVGNSTNLSHTAFKPCATSSGTALREWVTAPDPRALVGGSDAQALDARDAAVRTVVIPALFTGDRTADLVARQSRQHISVNH